MYNHVLVATDGSPGALRAVEVAGNIAAPMSAKATIVHVREPAADDATANAILDAARDALAKYRVPTEACLMRPVGMTNPGRRILEAQQATGADLVVVGGRGAGGGLRNPLLGRVSNWLVARAQTSVLVVR